jgi:hypothetical protein
VTKYLLITLLALTGCVIVNTQRPTEEPPEAPRAPLPKMAIFHRRPAAVSPKEAPTTSTAKPMRLLAGPPLVPVIPTWVFTNVGTYQIEASTNLLSWWPVAVVYSVTNVTLTSDTVNKRPMLFYRLTAIP